MRNTLKTILTLVLITGMAFSFVACTLESSTADDSSSNNISANEETKKEEANKENETSVENEDNTVFSVDTTEQMNDKWKMTYKECRITKELDSFTIAEDGTEFVIVFFEIENISGESQNFSVFWEEFYFDSIKTAQTIYGVSIDNSFQLTAVPVEPGRKANGYFLLQTSPDWHELEIIYDESLTNENEENVMRFTLTKNVK